MENLDEEKLNKAHYQAQEEWTNGWADQWEPGMPNPIASFNTSKGRFDAEIFLNEAPIAASNFIHLANARFYHGMRFHDVDSTKAQFGCRGAYDVGDYRRPPVFEKYLDARPGKDQDYGAEGGTTFKNFVTGETMTRTPKLIDHPGAGGTFLPDFRPADTKKIDFGMKSGPAWPKYRVQTDFSDSPFPPMVSGVAKISNTAGTIALVVDGEGVCGRYKRRASTRPCS